MTQPQADVLGAYQQQTAAIRAQVAAAVATAWVALGSWRSLADIAAFLRDALPQVLAGQRQMAELTAGYLSAHRMSEIGRSVPVRVDPRRFSGAAARGGAAPAAVYERPFHLVWRQLAALPREAGAVDKAIAAGRDRAVQTALTDLQLAKVQTSRAAVQQDREIVAYRRVLEGPYSCALCIVAATQRYSKSKLLPIHPGCDCDVLPIYRGGSTESPLEAVVHQDGRLVPIGDLADIHERIEERFGTSSSAARRIGRGLPKYRDVLVEHDHGEIGPVLGVKGKPFTGPDDLNPDGQRDSGDVPAGLSAGGNGGGDGGGPSGAPPSDERPLLGDLVPAGEPGPSDAQAVRDGLAAVVEGQYGPLSIKDTRLLALERDFVNWMSVIRDPDGREVGRVTRAAVRTDDGRLEVEHEFIEIEAQWRRQGFGSAFTAAMEDWYERSSVDQITLNAELEDGGLVWALKGYGWARSDDHQQVIDRLAEAVAQREGTAEVVARAAEILQRFGSAPFDSPEYPRPYEVATLGRAEGLQEWLGQRIMRGTAWRGVKALRPRT